MRLFNKKPKDDREQLVLEAGFPQMAGKGYREILRGLESAGPASWYLEIGSRSGTSLSDRNCNFIAVDPEFALSTKVFNSAEAQLFFQEESDAFFERNLLQTAGIVPDLAFIDGMHLIDYVLRDFRNTERAMSAEGVIALHDVLPFNSKMTVHDPDALSKLSGWTGDVWKIIPILQKWRPDLALEVVGAPKTGLLVVRNLDPKNTTLFDKEKEILDAYLAVELSSYGPPNFFGSFDIIDPATYLASLV